MATQTTNERINGHEIFGRQNKTYKPADMNRIVHIVGCGSLGSYIGLLLAKLGLNHFILWDDDTIAQHNVCNQAFNIPSVGQRKTSELKRIIRENSSWTTAIREVQNAPQLTIEEKGNFGSFDTIADDNCVIFSVADRIGPRQLVYKNSTDNLWIIDARTGSQYGTVLCCDKSNKRDRKQYDGFGMKLPEGGAEDGDCGMQSIAYSTAAVAALAVSSYIRMCNKQVYPNKLDIDFPTYDVMLMKSNGEVG